MLRQGICLATATLTAYAVAQGRPDIIDYFGGHKTGIACVATSPDGTRVATSQTGKPINMFDTATGKLMLAINGGARQVAFSPDGQRLIAGTAAGFTVYDATTGMVLESVGPPDPVTFTLNAGAISADGTRAAGFVSDQTAIIWNLETGAMEKSFAVSGITAASAAYSADGAKLSVGATNGHIVTYTVNGTLAGDINAHSGSVTTLSYRGTTMLSGSADRLVKTWNSLTGTHIKTMSGHGGQVYVARMSPNGQYVISGATNGQLFLWNAQTGGIVCAFWNHQGAVRGVDFTPNGADLVAGDDGLNVNHWRISGLILIRNYTTHKYRVDEVAISPDGRTVASADGNGLVKLWRGGALFRTIQFQGEVNAMSFSPNNAYLAVSGVIMTYTYNVETGGNVGSVFHSGGAVANAFHQDSQTFYSGCTGWELMRATVTGSEQWMVHLGGPVMYIAVPNNGNFVAAATLHYNQTQVWTNIHIVNIADGTEFRSWTAHTDYIRGMQFTSDAQLITQFIDGTVRAFNPNTGAQLWTRSNPGGVEAMALNARGDVMLTGENEDMRFFRMSDGAQLKHYDWELPGIVDSVAISPDERWYVYGLDTGTFATAKNPFASGVVGATLVRGSTVSGGMSSLTEADQSYWRIRPGPVLVGGDWPARVILAGTASAATASRFTFKAVVGASDGALQQDIELFDYQSNTWQLIDSRACSTADQTITFEQTADIERFVQPVTREVRARLSWRQFAPVLTYPWQARVDQAFWAIVP